MSHTSVKTATKYILWARAAGRCEYDGCRRPLFLDDVTKIEMNGAYVAHIVADKVNGPRGDKELSKKLAKDLSNLMLLCDVHHRLIDIVDVAGHPPDRLRRMKDAHEERVAIATQVGPEKQSHIVLYGANIGENLSPLTFDKAAAAMAPRWYPAEKNRPVQLGMANSVMVDHEPEFWQMEEQQLRRQFDRQVRAPLRNGEIAHLSVFGVAPQPLLVLLGSLLSDLPAAEVYQLQREPEPGWSWNDDSESAQRVALLEPQAIGNGEVALVVALSAPVNPERITRVLGDGASIWTLTISNPNNDFLKSREQLSEFRVTLRATYDRIRFRHPRAERIHLFPVGPVAAAVELGRVRQPKAHLPLCIYEEHRQRGGFSFAINVGDEEAS